MIHDLKCWPNEFEEIRIGAKSFDVRYQDPGSQRRYEGGDVLHLEEFDPEQGDYTGREQNVQITKVLRLWETPREWNLHGHGFVVVMAIKRLSEVPR